MICCYNRNNCVLLNTLSSGWFKSSQQRDKPLEVPPRESSSQPIVISASQRTYQSAYQCQSEIQGNVSVPAEETLQFQLQLPARLLCLGNYVCSNYQSSEEYINVLLNDDNQFPVEELLSSTKSITDERRVLQITQDNYIVI